MVQVVNSPPCCWRWCAGWELAGQTGAPQTSCTAALGNHRMWVLICVHTEGRLSWRALPNALPMLSLLSSLKRQSKDQSLFMVFFYIRMAAQSCMEDNFCNENGCRTTVPSCSLQTRMASLPLTFVLCHHAHCVRQAGRPRHLPAFWRASFKNILYRTLRKLQTSIIHSTAGWIFPFSDSQTFIHTCLHYMGSISASLEPIKGVTQGVTIGCKEDTTICNTTISGKMRVMSLGGHCSETTRIWEKSKR